MGDGSGKAVESYKAVLWELEGLKLALCTRGRSGDQEGEEMFWPKIMVNIHWIIRLNQG